MKLETWSVIRTLPVGWGTYCPGRTPVPSGRRSVAAGTGYQASGLHPLLWGHNYRLLWTASIAWARS